jgi:hypothetical protein
MKRHSILLAALLFVSAGTDAQVTIQHGRTLSELINNMYGGNGVQLKDTGHAAHFGDSQDFQNFSVSLQRLLQSRSLFPLPSAVGLVSYKFNDQTGTYERLQGSLGPLLADRGLTTGKGSLNVSATYTVSTFDQVNGSDTIDLVLRHCMIVPTCFAGDPNTLPFLRDTINVQMRLKLKTQALAISSIYGVGDNLDVGLVVPFIRNDLSVLTDASVIVAPGSSPGLHVFDPAAETPGQYGTGTAIGIGDIVARGKWRFLPKKPFDTAVLVDVTLPTGDKENFLGTGEVRTKVSLVASRTISRLIPHLNIGYEVNLGESKLNIVDYRIGTEYAFRPSVTLSGEILGVVRPSAASLFRSAALNNESLVGRSEIDGAMGAKWQVGKNRALLFNFILPLNDTGIRSSAAVTIGLQGAM